ncbi:MAG: hypothetical protein ABI397_00360 [Candidatus Saccharimonas sp.]
MNRLRRVEDGQLQVSFFVIIALGLLVLVFGVFSVWAYTNYLDQKKDVDGKVSEATAKAVLDNSQDLEAKFDKAYNEPLRQFTGPSDYGRLTFDYPKTWSVYQATDVSQGGGATYEAYLNPIVVPPVSDSQKFALRIKIEQKTYDQSVSSYDALVKKGDLKSSVYSEGDLTGTKFVGNFNKDIYGTAVLVKMRDRTLTIRTDGDVFQNEYDAILKTVKFNE